MPPPTASLRNASAAAPPSPRDRSAAAMAVAPPLSKERKLRRKKDVAEGAKPSTTSTTPRNNAGGRRVSAAKPKPSVNEPVVVAAAVDPATAVGLLDGWEDLSFSRSRPCSYATRASGPVFRMEVMPGGRPFTGGPDSGQVVIFHPGTGEPERVLKGFHDDSVLAIAFTPNGVFTAGADGKIVHWANEDLQKENVIACEGLITSLIYVPHLAHNGLFSAGDEAFLRQWNIESAEEVAAIKGISSCVNHLCADDACVFAACSDGSVCVFELLDRELKKCVTDVHDGDVWCVETEGDHIVTCGADKLIKIFDLIGLLDNTPISVIKGHRQAVRELQLYETLIFSTGHDGFVVVWDATLPEKPHPIEVLVASVPLRHHRGRIRSTAPLSRSQGDNGSGVIKAASTDFTDLQGAAALSGSTDADTKARLGPCRTYNKAFLSLNLEGNELTAAGMDGMIVKWNVAPILPSLQEVIDVPELVGGVDKEREAFLALPIHKRHDVLSRREAKRAIADYTELPINFVVESLITKVKGSRLNNELIPFILFITLFTVFVISDYSVIDVFNMTNGVQQGIDSQSVGGFRRWETFLSVFNLDVYHAWLTGSLVANMWSQQSSDSPSPLSSFRFVGQNELASAIRLRTQRASPTSCGINNARFRGGVVESMLNNGTCYGQLSLNSANQDRTAYACANPRSSCSWNATLLTSLFNLTNGLFQFDPTAGGLISATKFYGAGGFTVLIPGTAGPATANTMLQALVTNGFVDDVSTRMVVVEWFHYNAALDVFSSHKLLAEVLPGSHWRMRGIHNSFKIFNSSGSTGRLVFEGFFVLFILYWIIKFFTDAVAYKKLYGSMFGYLADVWALAEFVNMTLFIVSFAARWTWYSSSGALGSSKVRPFDTSAYNDELDAVANAYLLQTYINSVNVVLVFLKVLKYMQLNDKLNMLNRTLALASSNIIGVLLLFVYFVFAFAACANQVYGGNIYGFRTIDASYNSLMRLLVGDGDYEGMSSEARPVTLVFFWSFLVLSQFLLLNFLIAVLGDAFGTAIESRLPVPIDDAIVRAASEVARSLSVRALRITIVLLFHRRSRTDLTAEYATSMRLYRETILSDDARKNLDYDELDRTFVPKDEFLTSVPELLRTSDNLNFMDEVWYDLAYDYHYTLRDAANRQAHDQEELIEAVLGDELSHVQTLAKEAQRNLTTWGTLQRRLRRVKIGSNGSAGVFVSGSVSISGSMTEKERMQSPGPSFAFAKRKVPVAQPAPLSGSESMGQLAAAVMSDLLVSVDVDDTDAHRTHHHHQHHHHHHQHQHQRHEEQKTEGGGTSAAAARSNPLAAPTTTTTTTTAATSDPPVGSAPHVVDAHAEDDIDQGDSIPMLASRRNTDAGAGDDTALRQGRGGVADDGAEDPHRLPRSPSRPTTVIAPPKSATPAHLLPVDVDEDAL